MPFQPSLPKITDKPETCTYQVWILSLDSWRPAHSSVLDSLGISWHIPGTIWGFSPICMLVLRAAVERTASGFDNYIKSRKVQSSLSLSFHFVPFLRTFYERRRHTRRICSVVSFPHLITWLFRLATCETTTCERIENESQHSRARLLRLYACYSLISEVMLCAVIT